MSLLGTILNFNTIKKKKKEREERRREEGETKREKKKTVADFPKLKA